MQAGRQSGGEKASSPYCMRKCTSRPKSGQKMRLPGSTVTDQQDRLSPVNVPTVCRVIKFYGSIGDHEADIFGVPSSVDRAVLPVIASVGLGWDRVSVSRTNRCPNWTEMEQIKRMFFRDDEIAMQLHVPPVEHVNVHPFTACTCGARWILRSRWGAGARRHRCSAAA